MSRETSPASQRDKTFWSSILGFLSSLVSGIGVRHAGLGVAASCVTGGVAGIGLGLLSFFFFF